jgi:ribosomal protein L37AE/L43A
MSKFQVEAIDGNKKSLTFCDSCHERPDVMIKGGVKLYLCNACRVELAGVLEPTDEAGWGEYEKGYAAGTEQAGNVFEELAALRLQCRLIQARVTEMFREPALYEQQREWALARGLL